MPCSASAETSPFVPMTYVTGSQKLSSILSSKLSPGSQRTLCHIESQTASSVQFSSVAQSCPTLCDPMNHSTPGLPVHLQLPEFTQTHVHRASDAIQPSHLLSSPTPAPNPSSIRVFSNESSLPIKWPRYWSFSFSISPSNEYSGLISFRMDWFDLLAVQGTLKSISNTTVQKHQFFGAQLSS